MLELVCEVNLIAESTVALILTNFPTKFMSYKSQEAKSSPYPSSIQGTFGNDLFDFIFQNFINVFLLITECILCDFVLVIPPPLLIH